MTRSRYKQLSLVAILFAAFGIAACTRTEAEGGVEPVEIRYWTGWSGYELRIQKEIIREFERTHPHIRVRVTSVAQSYDKVRLAFTSGSTPDVMSCVWAEEIPVYAMRGLLEPLEPYLRSTGRSPDEWIPVSIRMGSYQGTLYGVAATTNCNILAYNKEVVRKAGLDPSRPPADIRELERWNENITEQANGRYRRVGYIPQSLELWAYAFGGGWYDPQTDKITAAHPRNVEALRWMASWSKKTDTAAMQRFEQTLGNYLTASAPFITGKVAVTVTGDFFRSFMEKHGQGVEWGYGGVNGPPDHGRRNVSLAGGSMFVIPSAARQKKAAWEFLNWFCGPEGSYKFCTAISNLPALKKLQEKPPYSTDPFLRFALEVTGGPGAFAPPPIPVWPQYKAEIARAEEYAVRGGRDPEKLLQAVQAKIEKELARVLETAPRQKAPH